MSQPRPPRSAIIGAGMVGSAHAQAATAGSSLASGRTEQVRQDSADVSAPPAR